MKIKHDSAYRMWKMHTVALTKYHCCDKMLNGFVFIQVPCLILWLYWECNYQLVGLRKSILILHKNEPRTFSNMTLLVPNSFYGDCGISIIKLQLNTYNISISHNIIVWNSICVECTLCICPYYKHRLSRPF